MPSKDKKQNGAKQSSVPYISRFSQRLLLSFFKKRDVKKAFRAHLLKRLPKPLSESTLYAATRSVSWDYQRPLGAKRNRGSSKSEKKPEGFNKKMAGPGPKMPVTFQYKTAVVSPIPLRPQGTLNDENANDLAQAFQDSMSSISPPPRL